MLGLSLVSVPTYASVRRRPEQKRFRAGAPPRLGKARRARSIEQRIEGESLRMGSGRRKADKFVRHHAVSYGMFNHAAENPGTADKCDSSPRRHRRPGSLSPRIP